MLEYLMLAWTIPTAIVSFTVFFNIIFFNGNLMENILFKIFKLLCISILFTKIYFPIKKNKS